MSTQASRFKLRLLGPFSLMDLDGHRISIPSRKGAALLAMLAVSRDGVRARGWLQSQLWGSRELKEANGSLRRELSDLRKRLNGGAHPLLICERDRVRLDLGAVSVDILEQDENARARDFGGAGEFLEGFDIPGEEAFEDWLQQQRSRLTEFAASEAKANLAMPHISTSVQAPQAGFNWSSSGGIESPSVTVLGFANLTGNSEEAYFAEGFKQELINWLSRLRWLAVIAGDPGSHRGSANSGHANAPGSKYVLDGTIRAGRNLMLIDVTLYESVRLQAVWSKRLEIARSVVATALDECLQELVAHLGAKIDQGEQSHARNRLPSDANITDLIWRGRWHLTRLRRPDSDKAQGIFSKALALDPHSSEALINVAHALAWAIWSGRQPAQLVHELRRLAQQAMQADPSDGRAYWLAGTAETWLRNMQPALDLLFQAVEFMPSLAIAHAQIGCTLNLCERPEQAGSHLQLARRLSPFDVHLFFVLGELAMTASLLGNYRDAIAYADLAIVRREQYWYAHMVKIDALVRLGEIHRAAAALQELLVRRPRFSTTYIDWIPFENRAVNQLFVQTISSASGCHAHPALAGGHASR
jgi:TolB-like protein